MGLSPSATGLSGDWSIFRLEGVFGERIAGRKHGPVPFRDAPSVLRPNTRRITGQEIARAAVRVVGIRHRAGRWSRIDLLAATSSAATPPTRAATARIDAFVASLGTGIVARLVGRWIARLTVFRGLGATVARACPRNPPALCGAAGQPGQNDHCQQ